jgi:hypothetical protein
MCSLPHPFQYMISITTSSAGPIECPLSNKCLANLDLLFACYESLKCSVYLIEHDLAVCPIYFMLQSGQVIG